jgi:hypothetical protein
MTNIIYLIKIWSPYLEDETILRAYQNRKDAELFIDEQIESMCKLAREDSDLFESETGYSPEVFTIEGSMEMTLRRLFHIEKVELY